MGKHKKRLKKQFQKHKEAGETMKEFLIRVKGNVRPEQQVQYAPGGPVTSGHPMMISPSELKPLEQHLRLNSSATAQQIAAKAPETAQEAPDPINEGQSEDDSTVALEDLTMGELKTTAKDQGLKGYSKMKKAELIEALNACSTVQ